MEVLLVDDAFLGLLAEIRAAAPGLRHVVHCGDGDAGRRSAALEDLIADTPRSPTPAAAATTCPASSTPAAPPGVPKGVDAHATTT